MSANWLPLTDYSTKYRVSVSTLRRRIKAEDIRFKFDDGKYLIFDEPPVSTPTRVHRPSLTSEATRVDSVEPSLSPSEIVARLHQQATSSDEPVLVAANRLLNELKKAYTLILQEKEEQILQLREEVSDLRTLVRVLESEVTRLRGF